MRFFSMGVSIEFVCYLNSCSSGSKKLSTVPSLLVSCFDTVFVRLSTENYRVEDTYQNHLIIKLAVVSVIHCQ